MGVSPPLRVDVFPQRERVVVAAVGAIKSATVEVLEAALDDLCAAGWKIVVLDLRQVSFIDPTGLDLLLRVDRLFIDLGLSFAIIEDPGPVRRLLDGSGLSYVLQRAERGF